ncbi:hypothetical protein EDB84DRAFT_1437769 [Lactarius hengduanensis]|nr:hypothetical protein EDB84DRAFT_1437769 [Lactarius hengduanensis]
MGSPAEGTGKPTGMTRWLPPQSSPSPPPLTSPAAGRSPLDSKMNSPESEEPPSPPSTTPTSLGQRAVPTRRPPSATGGDRGQGENDLAHPPCPIEGPLKRLGLEPRNVESVSADGSPRAFGPSYDFDALDSMYIDQGLVPKEDAALTTDIVDTNSTLKEELAREVTEKVIGWGAYHLGAPLQMSNENSFRRPKTVQRLRRSPSPDRWGAANHRGELMANGLTSSWMRLCLGLLAAMIRGALRSPPALTRGNRSLNGNPDPFPKHQDLDQLGGLFTSYRNHPDKSYPDSYFEKLITSLDETVNRLEGVGLCRPTGEELWELHFREEMERFRVNAPEMNDVKSDVKKHIFSLLNDEAMANLEEWKAVYKYEFIEAMQELSKLSTRESTRGRGRHTPTPPPLTLSQVVRDAVPQIQQEVAAQVDARIKDIHNEIRDLGANDPFWTSGPLQESIAKQVISATTAQIQHNLESETAALKLTADEELAALKSQCQHEYPLKLEDFKAGVWDMCKDWKAKYNTHVPSTLSVTSHTSGVCADTIRSTRTAAGDRAFKTYALDPLTVEGSSSLAPCPRGLTAQSRTTPHTPPTSPTPLFSPILTSPQPGQGQHASARRSPTIIPDSIPSPPHASHQP